MKLAKRAAALVLAAVLALSLTAVGDAAALVWKRLPRKSKAEENY